MSSGLCGGSGCVVCCVRQRQRRRQLIRLRSESGLNIRSRASCQQRKLQQKLQDGDVGVWSWRDSSSPVWAAAYERKHQMRRIAAWNRRETPERERGDRRRRLAGGQPLRPVGAARRRCRPRGGRRRRGAGRGVLPARRRPAGHCVPRGRGAGGVPAPPGTQSQHTSSCKARRLLCWFGVWGGRTPRDRLRPWHPRPLGLQNTRHPGRVSAARLETRLETAALHHATHL